MPARSPFAWTTYVSHVGKPSEEAAIFRARFRMASAFGGAHFPGVAAATADSYSAVLRCVLAVGTLESLRDAIHGGPSDKHRFAECNLRVLSPSLSDRLRREARLLTLLTDRTRKGTKATVERFVSDGSDDVLPVVRAIRHVDAHGDFTARGGGLTTKRARALVNDLAVSTLHAADAAFSNWVLSSESAREARSA